MKATCTAHMSLAVDLESGKVNCRICTFHVGHKNDHEPRRGSCTADSVQVGRSSVTSPQIGDCNFNLDDLVTQQLRDTPAKSIDDKRVIDAVLLKCRQVEAMVTSGTYTKQVLLNADKHLSAIKATLQVASPARNASPATLTLFASPAAPARLEVTRRSASNEKLDKQLKFRTLLPKPQPVQKVVMESKATEIAAFTLVSMTKLNDATNNLNKRNSTVLTFDEVPYCVKSEEVVSSR